MEIEVLNGQSLLDIAVQSAGSVEAVIDIAANNGVGITDMLPTGSVIDIPDVENKQIADYYAANRINPATGELSADLPYGGIEFMAIEIDFIVS